MSKPNESREISSVPSSLITGSEAGSEASSCAASAEAPDDESPSLKSTPKSLKSTLSVPSLEVDDDEEESSPPKSTPKSLKSTSSEPATSFTGAEDDEVEIPDEEDGAESSNERSMSMGPSSDNAGESETVGASEIVMSLDSMKSSADTEVSSCGALDAAGSGLWLAVSSPSKTPPSMNSSREISSVSPEEWLSS